MKRAYLTMTVAAAMLAASAAMADDPGSVSTFESIGLYWVMAEGSESNACSVRYRAAGAPDWRDGFPLWFDARSGEYRGSLVLLEPGTTYEIELTLEATGTSAALSAATWSEDFPVAETIILPEASSETLEITASGTPGGYVLYAPGEGGTATIDVDGSLDHCVTIEASYVILRGATLMNAAIHAIRLMEGTHDVVIEACDISGWGRVEPDGWGHDYDAAVYSNASDVARIVVQRTTMHHPRADTNSWEEYRVADDTYHPEGPQGIVLFDSAGNHVFRYNEVYGDTDLYFNDTLGAGSNFSTEGFPFADSDIHGNILKNCWDDAVESEGANRNVRIWGNYIDKCYVAVATAATSIGPLYVWRNIFNESQESPFGTSDEWGRGGFLKVSDNEGGGKIYVLHNTMLQPPPPEGQERTLGGSPGLGHGGPMLNTASRNNILHVSGDWSDSINDRNHDPAGDYDYDLYSGSIEARDGQETHGIHDVPVYDPANGEGEFALDPSSPGYDDGLRLFGFNDDYTGAGPDMGAHEAGTPPMQFGVDAYRDRPDPEEPDGETVPDGPDASEDGGEDAQSPDVVDVVGDEGAGDAPVDGAQENGEGGGGGCGCALVL